MTNVQRELTKIKGHFMWDTPEMVLFFSDSKIFRKKFCRVTRVIEIEKSPVATDVSYQNCRSNTKSFVCQRLKLMMPWVFMPQKSWQRHRQSDKDMKQIPGRLYNMDEMFTITEEQGEQWHYIQTLAGDQTDGYSGVPGIGIKRAVALFEEHGYLWKTQLSKRSQTKIWTEDVALMNARLAKILTNKEYDGRVISYPGVPPMPVTEMTMEQSFKLRRLEDLP